MSNSMPSDSLARAARARCSAPSVGAVSGSQTEPASLLVRPSRWTVSALTTAVPPTLDWPPTNTASRVTVREAGSKSASIGPSG